MKFTAVYRKVPEGYIGFVEELPGANTQGETLDEVRANIREAIAMVLEANRQLEYAKRTVEPALEPPVELAQHREEIVLDRREDDASTGRIMHLVAQSGAFDFWKEEGENIYSCEDGEPV